MRVPASGLYKASLCVFAEIVDVTNRSALRTTATVGRDAKKTSLLLFVRHCLRCSADCLHDAARLTAQ